MPLLPGTSVNLTRPHSGCAPPASAEAWSSPRRRPASRRRKPGWKARPCTPLLVPQRSPQIVGHSAINGSKRLWADLQRHAGALRRWLPRSWRGGREGSFVLNSRDSMDEQTEPRLAEVRRVTMMSGRMTLARSRINPEAAAANMGVDVRTYNMLMDLQHRDITPEDYETLRRLDSSIKPKTLSRSALEKAAPRWRIGPCEPRAGEEAQLPRCHSRSCMAGENCCICLESFSFGDCVRRLPCKHIFHEHCIDEWLTHCSDICPEDGLPVLAADHALK
uniref:RING-type domain-containing protein n=1 Tax=Chrysotila carterae TaxID=13221 RepID=A0A7S4B5Z0_CHRCT|mmetsp:Transcript_29724/g.62529  ORF Transcript_29724/g.62529 Transcript_29724/m.62529 type:complete len:277 (-) Transcript_29724:785-1615(-)